MVVAPLRMVGESLRDVGMGGVAAGWLLLATLPWLAISLGLRSLGLPSAWRSLFAGKAAAAAAAALALSGWPLGLLFHVAARDVEGRELPSATIYFVEQSGAVLWVFTAIAVAAWAGRARRPALVIGVAGLLSLPSTLEFAVRKARVGPDSVPAGAVRALAAIARDGHPGDVVLQRPGGRYPPLPAVLVGRRVVYERFTPYLTQFAPREELLRRHERLHRFFQTSDRDEALSIARALSGQYVCLYGSDRVRFDPQGILVPIHEEKRRPRLPDRAARDTLSAHAPEEKGGKPPGRDQGIDQVVPEVAGLVHAGRPGQDREREAPRDQGEPEEAGGHRQRQQEGEEPRARIAESGRDRTGRGRGPGDRARGRPPRRGPGGRVRLLASIASQPRTGRRRPRTSSNTVVTLRSPTIPRR